MEVLARVIKKENLIKEMKDGNEELKLFADDMVLYIENMKESTRKTGTKKKVLNEFSNLAGQKANS